MLLSALWSVLVIPIFLPLVCGQGPVRTLFPAAFPLAVKTPYLSTWYESYIGSNPLTNCWPQFWILAGDPTVMGWSGKVRVDGVTYKWMGQDGAGTPANVTNIQVTPTRTIFVMQAGPMNVTVTFLSPVEPDDWVKQSIPFSYVSVEAESLDGNSYPVQLYSDISAEWASGNRSSLVQWGNTNTGNSIYHKIELQSRPQTVETGSQAQDGTVYYAMSTSQSGISWQIDRNDTVRDGFQSNGKLANTESTEFVAISSDVSVFAFAVDLGKIQSTASPVTWSVGYVRDPAITYTAPSGAVQLRRPYYVTQYKTTDDVVDAFTSDYAGAYSRAVALDQNVTGAADKISSQYSDIVALTTRQVMATLDFTVGTDSHDNVVLDDVKVFMKNMGTDNRVNPVEHIYAAFPMFLYLNASIGRALLDPLLEVQDSLTNQSFAAMDIGNAYPTASSPEAVLSQGVEQSANMLIMQLAYARISGDGAFLSRYYNTTKRWADYLVSNSLLSLNQTNLDGDTTNLANTALKGIIGIKAISAIAHALGEDSDATEYYDDQVSSLLNTWLSLTKSANGSHLLGGYGDQQSWSLMYNLFADKMLGLNLVPQSVIDLQTQHLDSLLSTEISHWGFPVDSQNQQNGNTAWTLFTSAFMSDTIVRDALIERVHNHVNSNVSAAIFPEIYDITDNSYQHGGAGPALGGVFSHLALTVPNKTISCVSATTGTQPSGVPAKSTIKVRAIIGGVTGGLVLVCIVVAIVVVLLCKKRRLKYQDADMTEAQPHLTLSPYCSDDMQPFPIHSSYMKTGFARIDGGSTETYKIAPISLPLTDSSARAQRETRRPGGEMRQPAPSEQGAMPFNVGVQTGSAHTTSPRGSISTTDVVGLRIEVENLRQVMRDIREERLQSPPEYAE